jgi:Fic family protein
MSWNWEKKNWPLFTYNEKDLRSLEAEFLQKAGYLRGVTEHLDSDDALQLKIELLREEALSTSKIEGELLDRASVQSSIQKALGLKLKPGKIPAREDGIGKLSVELLITFDDRLSKKMLLFWHTLLMEGSYGVTPGKFRSGSEPMQIVSKRLDRPRVHFEAVPGALVSKEMTAFVKWFNSKDSVQGALAKSCIAHLYFLAIHPYEDGNGRIARALSEKALSAALGTPALASLSTVIEEKRSEYYRELEKTNRTLRVNDWVLWFSESVLEAQEKSLATVNFLLSKAALFKRLNGELNKRQEKALLRMFKEGPQGFKGGLSAENYMKITKASRPTATRDLSDLVKKKALKREGELRHTRYYLLV